MFWCDDGFRRVLQRRFKNMNIFGHAAGFSRPRLGKHSLVSLLGAGSI